MHTYQRRQTLRTWERGSACAWRIMWSFHKPLPSVGSLCLRSTVSVSCTRAGQNRGTGDGGWRKVREGEEMRLSCFPGSAFSQMEPKIWIKWLMHFKSVLGFWWEACGCRGLLVSKCNSEWGWKVTCAFCQPLAESQHEPEWGGKVWSS